MVHIAPQQAKIAARIAKLEAKLLTQAQVIGDAEKELEAIKVSKAPQHQRMMDTLVVNTRIAESHDRMTALQKEIEENQNKHHLLMYPVSALETRDEIAQARQLHQQNHPDIPLEPEEDIAPTDIEAPQSLDDSWKNWTDFVDSTYAYEKLDELITHPIADVHHFKLTFTEFQQLHNINHLYETLMTAAHDELDRNNIPHNQFANTMVQTGTDFDNQLVKAYAAYVTKYDKLDRRSSKALRRLDELEEEKEEAARERSERSARKAQRASARSASSQPTESEMEEEGEDIDSGIDQDSREFDAREIAEEISEDERDEERQKKSRVRDDVVNVDRETLKNSSSTELSELSKELLKTQQYTKATAIAFLKTMDKKLLEEAQNAKKSKGIDEGNRLLSGWNIHVTGKITKGSGKSTYNKMHRRIEEVISGLKSKKK